MAKLTLTDVTDNGLDLDTNINANNALIEAAVENTLSRDGTSPNTMSVNLDMNSNRINNLTDGVQLQDAVTVNQLTQGLIGVVVDSASLIGITDAGDYYTSTNVEDALQEIITTYLPGAYLPLAGGTMSGNIAMADNEIQRPEIKDYSITSTTPTSSSGAITFDCANGNAFQVTLTENITGVTLSNPPASGLYGEIIIKFVQDGTGSRTVGGWPGAVKWPGGTAPTITTTATTGTDLVTLKTWDGGTTWYGDYSQDYS